MPNFKSVATGNHKIFRVVTPPPPSSCQKHVTRIHCNMLCSPHFLQTALSHRIYDQEIIELNADVMFILIFPNEVCTPPNQSDNFSSANAYSALPVQSFEMNNMMTYQPRLMSSYCRLSSLLELENLSIQQTLRESILNEETLSLKVKQDKLSNLQQNVDDLWKVSRWIFDTLQACQDKNLNVGIPLSDLFGVCSWSEVINNRLSLASQASEHSISSFGGCCDRNSVLSTGSNNGCTDDITDSASCCSGISGGGTLKIYGTDEIGLSSKIFVEVKCADDSSSTALDVVCMATRQFLQQQQSELESSEPDSNQNRKSRYMMSEENAAENLVLVVVAGSRERVLRDDLQLTKLQNPWEKGTLYLRLKKEAIRATKWGLSTTV